MKNVLLLVVDACASRVLLPAVDDGRLPHIQALAHAGLLYPQCSAIFPSITPAATSSIITGRYPREHGVAGDFWYDPPTNDLVYFGADFKVIWNRGLANFFHDFLVRLNHDYLQASTLFQLVERAGLTAASINYLIFRGDVNHTVDVPRLLALWPGVPFATDVSGPTILRLGDFVSPNLEEFDDSLDDSGPLNRYGFTDKHTAQDLLQMAQEHAFPALTVAYFPDNDFDSHARGPRAAVTNLEQVDAMIGELIDTYGGLEPLLRDLCIILTGDHSQADMHEDEDQAGINLDDLLAEFHVAQAGKPWRDSDQLVICPNLRVAHIYVRELTPSSLAQVRTQLLIDRRIDQVLWPAYITGEGERGYYVATRDRGTLHFWVGDNGPHTVRDQHGGTWSWAGDLRAVDGQVSPDNVITFPTYPNAFERIAGGLDVRGGGHLWVTAHPGYEFHLPGMKVHTGGSHGALHALDSTVPLLLAGAVEGVTLPPQLRTVDVAPLCLSMLGITPPYPLGSSHITEA